MNLRTILQPLHVMNAYLTQSGAWRRMIVGAGAVCAACTLSSLVYAAEWRCGFEAAEGFVAGAAPQHAQVSVIGGAAAIVTGGAAAGGQFLRFVPQEESNALVLQLPAEVSAVDDRTISFSIRLVGEPDHTRLVLSYRETIALAWTLGGVEIEAGGQRVQVPAQQGGSPWIAITLTERAATGEWSIGVNGVPAVSRSGSAAGADDLAELLIFADGSLDLDELFVSSALDLPGPGATPDERVQSEAESGTSGGGRRVVDSRMARHESLSRAARGEYGAAEAVIMASLGQAESTGEGQLEAGQRLAVLAYVLRQKGDGRAAVAMARAALRRLDRASRELRPETGSEIVASISYLSGQIWDDILSDPETAKRKYREALQTFPNHRRAPEKLARIQRVEEQVRQRSAAEKGGRP